MDNFRFANTYIMSTLKTLLVPALLIASPAIAQKKQFTITEATNGMATTLAPKGLRQASWEPGTVRLFHSIKDGSYEGWVSEGFTSGNKDTLLDLKSLNHDVYGKDKLKALPTFQWLSKGGV